MTRERTTPDDTESEYTFTFPEQETLANWEAVQEYARRNSLIIHWSEERQLLCVAGPDVSPDRIIEDLGALIFREVTASERLYWDVGWRTSIEVGSEQYLLFIEGEPDDQVSAVQHHRSQAAAYIAANLGRWMQTIVSQIYGAYVEKSSNETPCSDEAFLQALKVTDSIAYDPTSNKYEVYVNAEALMPSRLIHLVEIPSELFEINLE